jgi:hypothetical protein
MRTVRYEAREGIFLYGQEDVLEARKSLDTDETRELIDLRASQAVDSVKMPQDNRIFPYAILKLHGQGKVAVFCKVCGAISLPLPIARGSAHIR